jgi:hypothetical protein
MAKRPPRLTPDDFDGVFDQRFGPLKIPTAERGIESEPQNSGPDKLSTVKESIDGQSADKKSRDKMTPDTVTADRMTTDIVSVSRGFTKVAWDVFYMAQVLTGNEFTIYCTLYRYSWGYDRNCISISQDDLAKLCGMSTKTVYRSLPKLMEHGLVELLEMGVRGDRPSRYRIRLPFESRITPDTLSTGNVSRDNLTGVKVTGLVPVVLSADKEPTESYSPVMQEQCSTSDKLSSDNMSALYNRINRDVQKKCDHEQLDPDRVTKIRQLKEQLTKR